MLQDTPKGKGPQTPSIVEEFYKLAKHVVEEFTKSPKKFDQAA